MNSKHPKAHAIIGGFPYGQHALHDMDFVRLQLLKILSELGYVSTVSASYNRIDAFLRGTNLLLTYTAGPLPNEEETNSLEKFLNNGGTWVSLHGSAGGFAQKPLPGEGKWRRVQKFKYHELMGGVFLNHPPHRKFTLDISHNSNVEHLTDGLPTHFETVDEIYLIELQDIQNTNVFLTTQLTDEQARNPPFGFKYDVHPALEGPKGSTLAIGYERYIGKGKVIYIGLGHTHSKKQPNGGQTYVHKSANPNAKKQHIKYADYVYDAKENFQGSWLNPVFLTLVHNALKSGLPPTSSL